LNDANNSLSDANKSLKGLNQKLDENVNSLKADIKQLNVTIEGHCKVITTLETTVKTMGNKIETSIKTMSAKVDSSNIPRVTLTSPIDTGKKRGSNTPFDTPTVITNADYQTRGSTQGTQQN